MVFSQGGLWKKRHQVRFCKFPVEDHAQDLLERFSVEAAVQDPCGSYV